MRRFLLLALLAVSLLPFAGPARAQVSADQLNKLSLEALTARPAGGGGGGGGYAPRRSYHPTYRHSYRPARRYAPVRRYGAPATRYRGRAVAPYRRSPAVRSHWARPTYHRPTYQRPTYHRPAYHAPARRTYRHR